MINPRLGPEAHLYGFDSDAYPNLAHHEDSTDWNQHINCLLLPFHDYIRYRDEENEVRSAVLE